MLPPRLALWVLAIFCLVRCHSVRLGEAGATSDIAAEAEVAQYVDNALQQSYTPATQNAANDECKGEHCCPVCGMVVTREGPRAVLNKGQELLACSDEHLNDIVTQPRSFLEPTRRVHAPHEVEGKLCPVCGMQAVADEALDFKGNQSVFFCAMSEDQKATFLAHTGRYVSEMIGANGTAWGARYCTGRTVMYMTEGFTFEDATCLVLLFAPWVLDSRVKMLFACLLCFLVAILHEALVGFRRRLVYKQRLARHQKALLLSSPGASLQQGASIANVARVAEMEATRSPSVAAAMEREGWLSRTFALDVAVALLYGVSLAIGYMLMLCVMTYHAGILMATVAGFSVGQLLFKDADAPIVVGEPIEVGTEPCCSG